MVSAAEIRDEASLRTWLEGRPREDAVAIAARAALRVAPLYWGWVAGWPRNAELTEHPISRAVLISVVAAARPTAELMWHGAFAARDASDAASTVSHYKMRGITRDFANIARAAFDAAYAATEAAYVGSDRLNFVLDPQIRAGNAVHSSVRAVATYLSGGAVNSEAAWKAVDHDASNIEAGRDPFARPLWPEVIPAWMPMVHRDWRARGGGWVFWADWYEGYLIGRSLDLDLDLLEQVALIEPEDWDKGDDHVNGIIERYYRDWHLAHVIRQNPYAVTVSVDARQQKLVAVPVEPRDLAEIVKATRAALRDFERRCADDTSHNRAGLTVLAVTAPVFSDLKRDLSRYRKFPVALFEAIEAARNEFLAVCGTEGLAQDGAVLRLSGALQTRAQDVCVADPAVLETVRKRMDVELTLLTRERIDLAVRLCRGMGADSAGWLKDAAALAVTVILDPARSESERRAAWYFIKAVVPRGAQAVIEHAAAAEAKPTKRSKLDQVVDAADKVYKLDKGSDAIQEAIADNSGWVSELLSNLLNGPTF